MHVCCVADYRVGKIVFLRYDRFWLVFHFLFPFCVKFMLKDFVAYSSAFSVGSITSPCNEAHSFAQIGGADWNIQKLRD
jgi:hypothetical protein